MARLPISERRKQIAQMVMEQGYISVRALSDCFQVSTETIRKDLLDLEQKTIINKGHGDATISSTYQENPFDMKVYTHIESKAKIAEKAVGLIPEGGVVMVDSGSTNMQVAKLLNLKNGLVVVTNSLSAAQVLSGTSNQLLVIGGELRSNCLLYTSRGCSPPKRAKKAKNRFPNKDREAVLSIFRHRQRNDFRLSV